MKILVLNAGSSSQKSALFDMGTSASVEAAAPIWEGKIEWNGQVETLVIRNCKGIIVRSKTEISDEVRLPGVERMLHHLWSGPAAVLNAPADIGAVGHRIVHGGPNLTEPIVVSSKVKAAISEVSAIDPLHNQAGLDGIELTERLLPGIPDIAVFDTGFHRTLPLYARVYPGPYEWYQRGIQRYGFHGINHEYCAGRAARFLGRDGAALKIITCHLGNGCSLAAIDGGKCVDTTMGFTPVDGLMMGTRSGSIDPGILLHLARTQNLDAKQLDFILNHRSGLLGISGESSDMREILSLMENGYERARLAFQIFVHRLESGIGAMAASLGGIDVLVFTAGIGENSPEVRRAACEKLGFLGIELDLELNSLAEPDLDISRDASRVRVLVIRAQEDWAIARECAHLPVTNSC